MDAFEHGPNDPLGASASVSSPPPAGPSAYEIPAIHAAPTAQAEPPAPVAPEPLHASQPGHAVPEPLHAAEPIHAVPEPLHAPHVPLASPAHAVTSGHPVASPAHAVSSAHGVPSTHAVSSPAHAVPSTRAVASPTHAVASPTHAVAPAPPQASAGPAIGAIAAFGETLRQGIRRSMQISGDRLEIVICALLAGGHLLLEDQPGVGKTQLARSIASTIDGRFARVQATVDLLPTDILGATVWHAATGTFEFHPGPVFTNVLLVDELNRATPKTQSGLLEAMQELQVTVDGQTHQLPQPFIVVATQNPTAGYDGTYPLPPAQLDRFIARLSLGYPTPAQEAALLREQPETGGEPLVTLSDLVAAQAATRQVATTEPLLQYVVSVLGATRHHPLSETGASPRSGLQLIAAARARAALQGRDYVLPDDIQALAPAVLAHRIQTVPAAPADAQLAVVSDALAQMPAR